MANEHLGYCPVHGAYERAEFDDACPTCADEIRLRLVLVHEPNTVPCMALVASDPLQRLEPVVSLPVTDVLHLAVEAFHRRRARTSSPPPKDGA